MNASRRGLAALATTAAVTAVTAVAANPAYAATVHGTAKVSGTTVTFVSAASKANMIKITRSGRTVTIDSLHRGWSIKAGTGCKAVSGDTTKVKCTTAKATKLLKVTFSSKDDALFNVTALPVIATGGAGSDQMSSKGGADTMYGGLGDDFLMADNGANRLYGGAGDDFLAGGLGADRMYGGPGNDSFRGLGGNDTLSDESGNNSFDGGAGNDMLYGGSATDTMRGGAGNDTLYGYDGTDYLYGDAGDDRLYSSPSSADAIKERVDGGSHVTAYPGDTCTAAEKVTNCETLV